jgi:hypothetical protein
MALTNLAGRSLNYRTEVRLRTPSTSRQNMEIDCSLMDGGRGAENPYVHLDGAPTPETHD